MPLIASARGHLDPAISGIFISKYLGVLYIHEAIPVPPWWGQGTRRNICLAGVNLKLGPTLIA